jgi:hypothetical protein
MTALIFPKAGDHGMELSVGGQEIILNSLELMLISV